MSSGGEAAGVTTSAPSPLLVTDIDGVLADVTHRQHFLEGRRDWASFFAAAEDDPPIPAGITAAQSVLASGQRLAFLTGRPERLREATVNWLQTVGLDVDPALVFCRPDHDRRPAALFKTGVLQRLARSHVIVDLWEDDPAVVDAVVALGLPARLVDWCQPRSPAVVWAQDELGRT